LIVKPILRTIIKLWRRALQLVFGL